MIWIAPSEKNAGNAALEKRLGDATDELRANSSACFVSEHNASPSSTRPAPPLLLLGEGGGDEGAEYAGDPPRELSMHGVEKAVKAGRPCRLNLAVHGREREIKHGAKSTSCSAFAHLQVA